VHRPDKGAHYQSEKAKNSSAQNERASRSKGIGDSSMGVRSAAALCRDAKRGRFRAVRFLGHPNTVRLKPPPTQGRIGPRSLGLRRHD
jgi:hypothetical protein